MLINENRNNPNPVTTATSSQQQYGIYLAPNLHVFATVISTACRLELSTIRKHTSETSNAMKLAVVSVISLFVGTSVAFQPHAARFPRSYAVTTDTSSLTLVCLLSPIRAQRRIRLSRLVVSASVGADQSEDETAPSKKSRIPKSVAAATVFVLLDVFFCKLFQILAISFPSSLGGCGALFATFLVAPGGEKLYDILSPGAALLAKWLPVFFVPSLITLPLADSVGSFAELLKVAFVIVGGFYFTLMTTAWTVVGIRKILQPNKIKPDSSEEKLISEAAKADNSTPPKAFSDQLNNSLRALSAVSGIASIYLSRVGSVLATPVVSMFMLSVTLTCFVFGARLPKKITKVVHPLVTCSVLSWGVAVAFAQAVGSSFLSVLKGYRTRSVRIFGAGAGDILLFLLGPAVVSLACQMYDRRKLMRENLPEVGAAVGVSSFGGVFSTAAAVRVLQIASPYLRLSLLSRNITSPLAMAIAGIIGADASLAVTLVVITGLIGANFGASILDSFGIKDPVARGLGIGAAAHGLGTAAFVNEEDAFPFAAISMALTASAATVIVSIPLFKKMILQLALGA